MQKIAQRQEAIALNQLNRLSIRIATLDSRIADIEAKLAALYEIDITTLTEQELILHNEEIAELEQSIIELNERILKTNQDY